MRIEFGIAYVLLTIILVYIWNYALKKKRNKNTKKQEEWRVKPFHERRREGGKES